MDRVSQACEDFELTISLKKTIIVGQDTEAPPVITVDDYEPDVVCQFTHLGSANNATLSPDTGFDKRIGKAASTLKLSCSSHDSSVGKPQAVCEANITMPALPAHCCMAATFYRMHHVRQDRMPRSIRRMLGIVWQDKMSNGDALSCGSLPHVPAARKIQPGYVYRM